MRTLILFVCLALQGCVINLSDQTPRVHASVSSLASNNSTALKLYRMEPSIQGVSLNDLQFKAYSKYLHRILKKNGFEQANDNETPEIVIFVGYGIGEPEESYYTYSMPQIGMAPTGVYNVNGTIQNNGNTSYVNSTVTQQQALSVTGYSTHVNKSVSYSSHLKLYAVDVPNYLESNEIIPVWQLSVASKGKNGDLRYVFPYLVAASDKFIGIDSGKNINVVIRQDNIVKRYVEGLESIIPKT